MESKNNSKNDIHFFDIKSVPCRGENKVEVLNTKKLLIYVKEVNKKGNTRILGDSFFLLHTEDHVTVANGNTRSGNEKKALLLTPVVLLRSIASSRSLKPRQTRFYMARGLPPNPRMSLVCTRRADQGGISNGKNRVHYSRGSFNEHTYLTVVDGER